ncbi:hypothetical protein VIGAN_10066000 [Vigna angularis var. angularis]|uniref:Transmembrane protein n=1 Tax=Vigna angularis var. angularis TaxID=157739 RepID=A0A0S3T229_PHAAN|nr:hypothetical protein VIGAN_10066000 [Vigna angularis var. angularis]
MGGGSKTLISFFVVVQDLGLMLYHPFAFVDSFLLGFFVFRIFLKVTVLRRGFMSWSLVLLLVAGRVNGRGRHLGLPWSDEDEGGLRVRISRFGLLIYGLRDSGAKKMIKC